MAGEVFSKLITSVNPKIMNASSRNGIKIDRIIIHHNATTNKDVAMNTWVKGGPAGTSAHYECTPDEIIGCVGEQYAAWHAGGTGGSDIPKISNPNQRSIGIENVNSSGAPNWSVDKRTIRNCAKLVADICKRYNIPLDRQHVLGHNEVTATACPGGINVDEVVRLAKEYSKGSIGSIQRIKMGHFPDCWLVSADQRCASFKLWFCFLERSRNRKRNWSLSVERYRKK